MPLEFFQDSFRIFRTMYHFSFVDFALFLAIADEQNLTRGA
jgi:hypothetical protein